MIRRRFLGLLTAAGATGVTALTKASHTTGPRETVVFKVNGFTCITCATGLETLLGREKGVIAVKASYPEGQTTVSFNTQQTNETKLKTLIEDMGFLAQRQDAKQS